MSEFAAIEEALAALRVGKPVLVLDDTDRENEGDVIIAGEGLTPEWIGWAIRYSSGYLCAPMPEAWADRLELPLMVEQSTDALRTAYTITVDAAVGVTTGISAHDRALTVRLLADPDATPGDFSRPGHVIPLRARDGGVLVRRGHTEATVDLCRLAGMQPVGVIGELVHDDGSMMRTPDVLRLGEKFDLPVITIEDLAQWRLEHDPIEQAADVAPRPRIERTATTRLPTEWGTFSVRGYRDLRTGAEHMAMISPRGLTGEPPAVRLHSECLTGDVFGSMRCDCGPQLHQGLAHVAEHGGAVVYLRGHEGRGIGLLQKLAAYELQDSGFDTVDAQVELGLPIDAREYGAAAAILADLGLHRVQLLTNNPAKVTALEEAGVEVTTVIPSLTGANPHNARYLSTKRDRMGHQIPVLPTTPEASAPAGIDHTQHTQKGA